MKNYLVSLFLFFLFGTQLFYGQERITVKAGEDINQVLSTGRYLFPEFQKARVFLQNETLEANMNYNALSGQMEFLTSSGDILELETKVLAVVFPDHYFKKTSIGYLEILADDPNFELLVHQKYLGGDIKKQGAYGSTSSTTAIDNISYINVESRLTSLSLAQEITYNKKNTYYLGSEGKYRIANKSSFSKLFGKLNPDMRQYLKNTPVNFSKEEDLIRLFIFCTRQ